VSSFFHSSYFQLCYISRTRLQGLSDLTTISSSLTSKRAAELDPPPSPMENNQESRNRYDRMYNNVNDHEAVSRSFRTESITKYMLTTINTGCDATQRVTAAKLTRLTHKIPIKLHVVAASCTICSSRSRRPVRELVDAPSYICASHTFFFF
jgi:hypothetical protein